MEGVDNLAAITARLGRLNKLYSVWQFNPYLRVTFVSPSWLVVWDHRHQPPARQDFRDVGDHQTMCELAAAHLQKLVSE